MATESVELEGFICPICFADLGSMYHLHGHFESDHPDEDTVILDHIKSLFGKAKKFISKDKQPENTFQPPTLSSSSIILSKLPKEAIYSEPQEIGPSRSHTDFFKGVRERRVDRFMRETNNILNRLDKLITIDPTLDDKKRKDIEKSLVAWAADKQTKICMLCGQAFNLRRRRHHCRLCGCVLCHKCSHFLSHEYACRLVTSSISSTSSSLPFKSSDSQSSLNSFVDTEGSQHLRICSECRFLLEKRVERTESRSHKPPVLYLYERIKEQMDEADELIPVYSRMAASLSIGESTHSLQEATELRSQLMKLCQSIAGYVKTLSQQQEDEEEGSNGGGCKLRSMLSQQVGWYVQEKLMSLPKLPSEEEIVRVRERRRRDAEERIAEERRVEEVWRERFEEKMRNGGGAHSSSSSSSSSAGVIGKEKAKNDTVGTNPFGEEPRPTLPAGWLPDTTPTNSNPFGDPDDDDPLVQQMNNIERYIMQARKEKRVDELKMLEENLRQLQLEFDKKVT